jgi:hypothetical protein
MTPPHSASEVSEQASVCVCVPLLTLKFNYQAKKEARERESMRPNGFIFTCVRANSFALLARTFFLVQFFTS